jgi:hypothetical protein
MQFFAIREDLTRGPPVGTYLGTIPYDRRSRRWTRLHISHPLLFRNLTAWTLKQWPRWKYPGVVLVLPLATPTS